MFQLSLVDHIRLSFGSAVTAYEGHVEAAERLVIWIRAARIATLLAVGTAAVLALAGLNRGGTYQTAAAIAAVVALLTVAAYVAFDPHPRIYGHRASATRFWLICENYRSLLAEIRDGLLDVPAIKERRNALLQDVAALLEQGPPADRDSYRIARRALASEHRAGYSEADLDRFLPPSLRSVAPTPPSSAHSAA